MREVTELFVLTAPALILAVDLLVAAWFGPQATITDVVRGWAARSAWPEAVYLLLFGLLYVHLFRRWL
jgi:hypothetical protein